MKADPYATFFSESHEENPPFIFFLFTLGVMESGDVHTLLQSLTNSIFLILSTAVVSVRFTTTVLFHLLVPRSVISSVEANMALTLFLFTGRSVESKGRFCFLKTCFNYSCLCVLAVIKICISYWRCSRRCI